MPGSRYPFLVGRSGDRALFVMDSGEGFMREREMPFPILQKVGTMCQALLEEARPDAAIVPEFPEFLQVLEAELPGVCRATLGFHRLPSGAVERVVSLYDEGDDQAPVLILVEDQIDEFIGKTE